MSPIPTKFRVSDKTPEIFYKYRSKNPLENSKDLIKSLRQYEVHHCSQVLQTTDFTNQTIASENGFVRTVVDCYNNHYNLIIRPDDIWAAIMTQFSFYVNANADKFRGKFVNFEGKKELEVTIPGGLTSAPYDMFVTEMSKVIHKNLVDPKVKDWVLPNFSTTTENDRVSIGVVFMATMKKYFDYKSTLFCGIPWITLEGTVEDWEEIHSRLAKLKSYNLQQWYNMLEPILKQFVNAKKGNADVVFWNRICHNKGGDSGPSYICGWITAFCAFDKDGKWQGPETKVNEGSVDVGFGDRICHNEGGGSGPYNICGWITALCAFDKDGKWQGPETNEDGENEWLQIEMYDIPTGIVEVDVKLDDNGTEYHTVMFAGHMATEVQRDGMTLKPTLGWSISLKSSSPPDGQNRGDRSEFDNPIRGRARLKLSTNSL